MKKNLLILLALGFYLYTKSNSTKNVKKQAEDEAPTDSAKNDLPVSQKEVLPVSQKEVLPVSQKEVTPIMVKATPDIMLNNPQELNY